MKTLRKKATPQPEERRTGAQTLKVLLADEMPLEQAEPVEAQQAQIILYLREGLKGVERNWTKYPNKIHSIIRDALGKPSDGILYIYMWRCSWGFGRNYCRLSQKQVVNETLIDSIRTAKRAFDALAEKHFIVRAMTEDEELDVTKQGTLYRVITPDEIEKQTTVEGVGFEDIPSIGVIMLKTTPDKINGVNLAGVGSGSREPNYNKAEDDPVKNDRGNYDRGNYDTSKNDSDNSDRSTPDKNTPDKITGVVADSDNNRINDNPVKNDRGKNGSPLKEERSKDTLSLIITGFYSSIKQDKISKGKRESGGKVIEELLADGFSLEDIQFAAEWTPGNAKEELYDFSIIKHTIGQAIAVKAEVDKAAALRSANEEARQQEQADREAEEAERGKLEALKGSLSDEERSELRLQAENAIKASGEYKAAFITDALIEAKENEILRTK